MNCTWWPITSQAACPENPILIIVSGCYNQHIHTDYYCKTHLAMFLDNYARDNLECPDCPDPVAAYECTAILTPS